MSSNRLKAINKFRNEFQRDYGGLEMSWTEMWKIGTDANKQILGLYVGLFFVVMIVLFKFQPWFVMKNEQTFQYMEKVVPNQSWKTSSEVKKSLSMISLIWYSFLFSIPLFLGSLYWIFQNSFMRRYFLRLI